MASKALVRGRSEHGSPLRRLDLDVLRQALSRLILGGDVDGLLVYQLVVEGAEPALVAAERGVSRAALVEELREAVDALAVEYEDEANKALDRDGSCAGAHDQGAHTRRGSTEDVGPLSNITQGAHTRRGSTADLPALTNISKGRPHAQGQQGARRQ
jgi:hypothetical protein